MTRMGRAVLPVSEQILFALNWLWRHCISRKVAPYVPDFKQAFDHFCLHAGEPIHDVLGCETFINALHSCDALISSLIDPLTGLIPFMLCYMRDEAHHKQ